MHEGVVGVPKMSGQKSGVSLRQKKNYIHICPKTLSSRDTAHQRVDFSSVSVYM